MEWTPEQEELRDAVRAVLARHPGHAAWAPLTAQVGAAALAVPEEYGGLGCGAAEVGVVMAELGRALSPVPYLGSAVLTVRALLAAGDEESCAKYLPALADGSLVGALAWAETPGGGVGRGGWEAADMATRAEPNGGGWLLTGTKRYVLAGPSEPSLVLVFATIGGDPDPEPEPGTGTGTGTGTEPGRRTAISPGGQGNGSPSSPGQGNGSGRLALFELTAPPAAFTPRSTVDRTRPLAELTLARTPARLLSPDGAGVLARVRDLACTALAAEQAGAAGAALEATVRYAKDRVQFGRPIGSFQAVKHRLADMYAAVESARSMALAAAAADAPPHLAAAAKSACSQAYSYVAGEMIQLHGGIGITWEHEAHEFFKRAHGSALLFGSPAEHRTRLAAELGYVRAG
ncbi:acyl-CoA/acyl-ACP dehydrogenase [Streptomyces sp. NBC_01351]|nr:acyl-CoA dehydrogenase family protein [Streptomyces sp. NBC_01351]